jgi:hypothetical protein
MNNAVLVVFIEVLSLKYMEGVKTRLHVFLISALDGSDWSNLSSTNNSIMSYVGPRANFDAVKMREICDPVENRIPFSRRRVHAP